MAKVYVTKCIVRKDNKQYQRGDVIEGLSDEEIERGIAQHWLEAVGNACDPKTIKKKPEEGSKEKEDKPPATEKKPEKGGKEKENKPPATERDRLIEKAVDLGILDKITDETTVEEIQQLIAAAQAA